MGSSLSSGLKEFAVLRGRQRRKQRPTVYYGVAPYPAWDGDREGGMWKASWKSGIQNRILKAKEELGQETGGKDVMARYKHCVQRPSISE